MAVCVHGVTLRSWGHVSANRFSTFAGRAPGNLECGITAICATESFMANPAKVQVRRCFGCGLLQLKAAQASSEDGTRCRDARAGRGLVILRNLAQCRNSDVTG